MNGKQRGGNGKYEGVELGTGPGARIETRVNDGRHIICFITFALNCAPAKQSTGYKGKEEVGVETSDTRCAPCIIGLGLMDLFPPCTSGSLYVNS